MQKNKQNKIKLKQCKKQTKQDKTKPMQKTNKQNKTKLNQCKKQTNKTRQN